MHQRRDEDGWETPLWKTGGACWWGTLCPVLLSTRTTHVLGVNTAPRTCLTSLAALLIIPAFMLAVGAPLVAAAAVGIAAELARRVRDRFKIRQTLGIAGSIGRDFLATVCCSACAVAQEAREAWIRHYPIVDVVTGELPALEKDRPQLAQAESKLWAQLLATSQLSRLLLSLGAFMVLAGAFRTGFRGTAAVMLIFAQAAALLYVFYWQSNRSAVQLDLVIKLFAAGFCVAPLASTIAEAGLFLLLCAGAGFVAAVAGPSGFAGAFIALAGTGLSGGGNAQRFVAELPLSVVMQNHAGLLSAGVFVAAGLMAAAEQGATFLTCRYCGACRGVTFRAVAVGLLSVALGYATFDSLVCVFGRAMFDTLPISRPLGNRLAALLVQLLLPKRAVCAALQAVGLCQRGGDGRLRRWPRAIAPAVALQAACRFATMASYTFSGGQTTWRSASFVVGAQALLLAASAVYAKSAGDQLLHNGRAGLPNARTNPAGFLELNVMVNGLGVLGDKSSAAAVEEEVFFGEKGSRESNGNVAVGLYLQPRRDAV